MCGEGSFFLVKIFSTLSALPVSDAPSPGEAGPSMNILVLHEAHWSLICSLSPYTRLNSDAQGEP